MDSRFELAQKLFQRRRLATETEIPVQLIDCMGTDRLIAMCAWASTDKWQEALTCPEADIVRIIRAMMRNKHASPFGHPHMTLFMEAPIPIWTQILRHRSWASFSLFSLRYSTAAALHHYIPEQFTHRVGSRMSYRREPMSKLHNLFGRWAFRFGYAVTTWLYMVLIKAGYSEEQSRFLLPAGIMTKGFGTVSLRNALNFLVLRDDEHAQKEVRDIAGYIRIIMEELWPITMMAWKEYNRPQI